MDKLNHENKEVRLAELQRLVNEEPEVQKTGNVNNHIHTFYSFSPYSPTKAVYMARKYGLETAGIMDHDSVAGCREFIKAGEIANIATTVGAECRVSFAGTPLEGRRINNPDQSTVAYVAMHSIPHKNIEKVAEFFAPYTVKRNERNKKMIANLNEITGIPLDFDSDVVPLSKLSEGGSITERHILYALAGKIMEKADNLPEFLNNMGVPVSEKVCGYLTDDNNPHKRYDLLGVLKGYFVKQFYVDATDECPHVTEYIKLTKEVGAISAYAYLGDVGVSVTGDKAAQKFEDDYLPLLFEQLHTLGFDAVTYMPTRNTLEQLLRVKEFCKQYNLMEISGEDINSPRQTFICEALKNPVFSNLVDSTWELIRHEREE